MQKPPDLDENLNPIKPPDLDASGSPMMNFATVNNEPIDVGDTGPLNIDYSPGEEPLPEHPAIGMFEKMLQPIVDVSPETRQHMAEFEQVHPYLGKFGRTALDFVLGESSPLSLGLGALGAGESVAAKAGMEGLSSALKIPSRAAGAGMMYHGLSKVGDEDTLGGKIGGGLEAALGGLAVRGPRAGRVNLERPPTPEMIKPELEAPISQPLSEPSVPPSLEPELSPIDRVLQRMHDAIPVDPKTGMKIYNPEGMIPDEINPKLVREAPTSINDLKFFEKFVKEESGEAKFPDLKGGTLGTKGHPLRALDELHDALIDASTVRNEQQQLYKGERSKRFAKVEEVTTQGKKGMYERLSKLKGELPKAQFEPVDMNPDSARALYNEINRSSLSTPEKIRASTGLGKVLGDYGNGEVPQRNEIEMMRKVFGDPVADQLMELHSGIPITKQALNEVMNLSKSMMSSLDASAPFRQGLGLIHTREFWQNYAKMYTYLGRGAYDAAMMAIHEDPMFPGLEKAGLQITEIGSELGKREEQFASRLAEKIPGIPASERMYTGFLNKTRFDISKRLMEEAERAGLKPFVKNSAGELVPTKLGREITKYVNTATGRGSLGRLEKNAVELNSLLFSPRLISSRLTMLNPAYYIKADPFVRKQALKSLFAMATAGKIVEELGKAAGGTVETADKTSSDYHKVRIGNTRIDPYGGFQQYIVAANRLLAGAANSTLGNKDGMNLRTAASRTLGVGGRYPSMTENKLSPVAKFVDDMIFARPAEDTGSGSAMDVMNIPHRAIDAKIVNLFTPMMLQDLADLMKEDPRLIPLGILSSQGMGVQTYQPSSSQQNKTGFRELVR